jgi:hypothetical protein
VTVLAIVCCVSRTVPGERFRDSRVLQVAQPQVQLPDPQHYTFAVVGDLHIQRGDTARFRRILTAASAEGDAFGVFLGDLVDNGLESDFAAYARALADTGWSAKAFSVIGNHDIFGDGWTYYKQTNGPSHYTFQIGNAKFIALDTADGSLGAEQAEWLKTELSKPNPGLLFLASHYMPDVPGISTYLRLADEVEAARLMALATRSGVRAWFGAHYHSYVVGSIEGVDYVVAGGGGGKRMPPVAGFFFVQVAVNGQSVSYTLRNVE